MVIMEHDQLEFRFPEVHKRAQCRIEFQRTLRIPDDNRRYPLPPGLGNFPLLHVEDYADKLPSMWGKRRGVFLPIYQAEALWINFDCDYPCAVKIAAGKINAVTGKEWSDDLTRQPQDYVVIPRQPWLDGFCVQEGLVRQFVAMPLGAGYTTEEQITGKAEFGGLQIVVYPMKKAAAEEFFASRCSGTVFDGSDIMFHIREPVSMGLAPGGLMRQKIYEDDYGDDVWETQVRSRCFVHLLNSEQYRVVTGNYPPQKQPTAADYTKAGLPWFDYYNTDRKPLPGSKILSGLLSVGAKQVQQGQIVVSDTERVDPQNIVKLNSHRSVEGGSW